jgi:hypothetical protein
MLARALALAIAVIAGLIGLQGPEFAQQYRQRADGALEELMRIVTGFDAEAAREGLTPAEGVGRSYPPWGADTPPPLQRFSATSINLRAILRKSSSSPRGD